MGQWVEETLEEILFRDKKSPLKAGIAEKSGRYKFYVSSKDTHYSNELSHSGDGIVMGTGGNASIHFAQGEYGVSTDCIVLKIKGNNDTKYMYYTLNNRLDNIEYTLFEGSGLKHLNKNKFNEYIIYYPQSLTEQKKIARILSTLDDAIATTQTLIDKHEAIKEGMMHDFFSRGIDPQTGQLRPHPDQAPHLYKESELGLIPKEWEVERLGDILGNIIDYRGKTPTKTSSGIPLITAKNVRMGYIDYSEMEYIDTSEYDKWMIRGIPQFGDVLFTTEAPCGYVASLDREDKVAFAQRVIILQAKNQISPGFIKYYLINWKFQKYLSSKATGSTVKGIQSKKFILFNVSVPKSFSEQKLIYKSLNKYDERIDSLQNKKQKLLLQKQGLMHDLLSGKVRVE